MCFINNFDRGELTTTKIIDHTDLTFIYCGFWILTFDGRPVFFAMASEIQVKSGNVELDKKINQWLSWDKVIHLMETSSLAYVLFFYSIIEFNCKLHPRWDVRHFEICYYLPFTKCYFILLFADFCLLHILNKFLLFRTKRPDLRSWDWLKRRNGESYRLCWWGDWPSALRA